MLIRHFRSAMAACLFPMSQALHGEELCTKFVDYAQLDAFTAEAFKGNPAFVCLLPVARSKEWMQNVAAEFNAPMTAFLVARSAGEFDVRFFTPTDEIGVCGHASLASAYLMFKSNLAPGSSVVFHASATTLEVTKTMHSEEWQGQMDLTLPLVDSSPVATNVTLPRTLQGCEVISSHETSRGRVILELASAKEVETMQPCFEEILAGPGELMVTGRGSAESGFDFVSRVFAPNYGVPEDPVCGTAHCALASLWARKLEKKKLVAYQASKRGGVLELLVDSDSKCVVLRGTAVLVATGVLLC